MFNMASVSLKLSTVFLYIKCNPTLTSKEIPSNLNSIHVHIATCHSFMRLKLKTECLFGTGLDYGKVLYANMWKNFNYMISITFPFSNILTSIQIQ